MYSQNNEEQIILDYFRDFTGSVLDLGANDGKRLSNSLKVIENGWYGVLVEPSPLAFQRLSELHEENSKVQLLNFAVSDQKGFFTLSESGSHLNNGDIALLSTLVKSEVDKWRPTGAKYREVEIECINFNQLLDISNHKTFDLISIDIEGKDLEVLKQIDLEELECKMLIIEHNNNQVLKAVIVNYCYKYGMRLHHENYENLIFIK